MNEAVECSLCSSKNVKNRRERNCRKDEAGKRREDVVKDGDGPEKRHTSPACEIATVRGHETLSRLTVSLIRDIYLYPGCN